MSDEPERPRVGADAPDSEPGDPFWPILAATVSGGVTLLGLVIAAISGGPYLSFATLNAGMVVFAIGGIAALFAAPFLIQRTVFSGLRESERRWERALLSWGGIAVVTLLFGLILGAAGGFDGDSLIGSIGLVAIAEAAIVIIAVGTMMLEG